MKSEANYPKRKPYNKIKSLQDLSISTFMSIFRERPKTLKVELYLIHILFQTVYLQCIYGKGSSPDLALRHIPVLT